MLTFTGTVELIEHAHDRAGMKSLLSSSFELRSERADTNPIGLPMERPTVVFSGSGLLTILQDAVKIGGWKPAGPTLMVGLGNRVPLAYISSDGASVASNDARLLAMALRSLSRRARGFGLPSLTASENAAYAARADALAALADRGGFTVIAE